MSDSVWPHRRKPTRLPCPWDSPGSNTGVGCYFLLQCMKVKSEREVVQLCPTLSNPMDYSPPGSSIHGIFQARVLEWGANAFSILLISCCQFFCSPLWSSSVNLQVRAWVLRHVWLCDHIDCSLPASSVYGISQARILECVAVFFSWGSSWPRDQICVSCISRQILYHYAT